MSSILGLYGKQQMPEDKQPKISIITVCFNEPKENVTLTFDSITSQSYKNTEWIVIDGGSKPETLEAINAYSNAIDNFVSEPDNGIYDAMNKGLSIASGDFVIFMNVGDRFYSSETIEQVVDYISANPKYDCYYGDAIVVDKNGKEWERKQARRINRFMLRYTTVCHQAIISRRSIYNSTGGFDINYKIIADTEWILKSLAAGAKWFYIGFNVCCFDNTGCSSNKQQLNEERIRLIKANYNNLELFVYYIAKRFINLKQRIIGIPKCL